MYLYFMKKDKDAIFEALGTAYTRDASMYYQSPTFEYWYMPINADLFVATMAGKLPEGYRVYDVMYDICCVTSESVLHVSSDYNNFDSAYRNWFKTVADGVSFLAKDTEDFTVENPLEVVILYWTDRGYSSVFKGDQLIIPTYFSTAVSDKIITGSLGDYSFALAPHRVLVGRVNNDHRDNILGSGGRVLYSSDLLEVLLTAEGKRSIVFNYISQEIADLIVTEEFWNKFILKLFKVSATDFYMINTPEDLGPSADMLVEHFKAKDSQELVRIERENESLRLDIEDYIRTITVKKISLETNHKKETLIRLSMLHTGKRKSSIIEELQGAANLPIVKGLQVQDNSIIKVLLDEISVDGVVPIGPYLVTLNVSSAEIRVENLEGRKNGFDHPHVSNGNPCWGNYNEILVHLSRGEIQTTVELLQVFLSTWNPRDEWGKNLIHWDPKYTFETFKEMDILYRLESYHRQYREVYGEDMYSSVSTCSNCGERNCVCDNCSECGNHIDDCDCNYCDECGNHYDECTCHDCSECGYHIDDCHCRFCEECDTLLYDDNTGCENCQLCSDCSEELCNCGEVIVNVPPITLTGSYNSTTTF